MKERGGDRWGERDGERWRDLKERGGERWGERGEMKGESKKEPEEYVREEKASRAERGDRKKG